MRRDAGQGGVIGRGWLQDPEWGPGDPSNNQHTHSLFSFDDEDDDGDGGGDDDDGDDGDVPWGPIKQPKHDDGGGGGDEDEDRGVH